MLTDEEIHETVRAIHEPYVNDAATWSRNALRLNTYLKLREALLLLRERLDEHAADCMREQSEKESL
jgi:hypothetical protein